MCTARGSVNVHLSASIGSTIVVIIRMHFESKLSATRDRVVVHLSATSGNIIMLSVNLVGRIALRGQGGLEHEGEPRVEAADEGPVLEWRLTPCDPMPLAEKWTESSESIASNTRTGAASSRGM
ncbi:unnamed protein product [Prorocentrum cordatum]|uniref:Coatomer subunit delta n=1 Tax=Prorocentrum cordatum TaxID=2364126 RepID=A0ABN9W1B9_9DINO|nr:unnamed protein product [Polarella glacialis]